MKLEEYLFTEEPRLTSLLRYCRDSGGASSRRIPHPDGNVEESARYAGSAFRKASVLIPVIKPSTELPSRIVLTVRSADLSSHAGQVSLPGGTREVHDSNEIMTALREAEEEIGLAQDQVEIIGQLGQILLPSGFEVTPVIGLIEPEPALRACPVEVEEIFTAPTNLLLDPNAYAESIMEYQGRQRRILELFYQGFRVWGATAAILHHLAREIDDLSG